MGSVASTMSLNDFQAVKREFDHLTSPNHPIKLGDGELVEVLGKVLKEQQALDEYCVANQNVDEAQAAYERVKGKGAEKEESEACSRLDECTARLEQCASALGGHDLAKAMLEQLGHEKATSPVGTGKGRSLALLITAFDEWELRGYGDLEMTVPEANVIIDFFDATGRGMKSSNLDKCIEYLKKTQKVRDNVPLFKKGNGDDYEEDDTLLVIARLCVSEKKYDKAIHYYSKVLSLRQACSKYLSQDERDAVLASTMNELGSVHNRKAKYLKGFTYEGDQLWRKSSVAALDCFKQALDVQKRLHGDRHKNVADVLVGVASTNFLLEEYSSALSAYEMCLAIRELSLGKFNKHTRTIKTKVADTYFTIGLVAYKGSKSSKPDLEKAIEAFTTCTKLRTENLGPKALETQQSRAMINEVKNKIIEKAIEEQARRGLLFSSQSAKEFA